jgi:3-oxoacyl-[acyl-carrier protein] reductase
VTGGNSGIGKATCFELAEKGAKVILLGRNVENNNKMKEELISKYGFGEAYAVDVADHGQVKSAFDDIYEKHGQVDILICNAGGNTAPTYGTKMTYEDFDHELKVQIYGSLFCIKECGERMKERKYGRIVVTASIASNIGLVGNLNYSVSKAGLMGMVTTLAKEFGPYGVTINAVQPGVVMTTFVKAALGETEHLHIPPIGRMLKEEDVSNAIAFLCSPKSGAITGTAIRIDGGYELDCSLDKFMLGAVEAIEAMKKEAK